VSEDTVQLRARTDLLERLQYFALDPQRVLDLGAGRGEAATQLQRRFPRAQVLAIDIDAPTLRAMPRPPWSWRTPWRAPWRHGGLARVCADARALPLPAGSVELIYSNLMLPWCDEQQAVFAELARALKPGGVLIFSTFGPDTLSELRAAWSAVDTHEPVSEFADIQQIGNALLRAGFDQPVTDREHYRFHYPDAQSLMAELRQLDSGRASRTRSRLRGLTGRARLQRMLSAYEQVRTPHGLPATFEVIFGTAFGREPAGIAPLAPAARGEFAVSVSSLRRPRR